MDLRLPATFAALRHPNYRAFFLGQTVSLAGTWMQIVAQGWLVLKLTNSAFLLGLVLAAEQAPVLILSLWGGLAADRVSKRRLLIATQSALGTLALGLGSLTALGVVRPWHVIVFAALTGIANAFDGPVRQAFLVDLVGQEDLLNAVALNSSIFHGARIVGPTIAGFLVATVGLSACFFVNCVSFAGVIAALMRMPLRDAPPRARSASAWRDLVEGVRYVVRHRRVAAMLLLVATYSVFGMSHTVLLPIFARDVLHVGAQGLGMLYAASGAGALAGALTLASFGRTRRRTWLLIIGLILFSAALAGFAASRVWPLSLALLAVCGMAGLISMATCNTLIQTAVPDALRGRVMGIFSVMLLGFSFFGSLQVGALGQRLGAPVAAFMGAVVCLVATAAVVAATPGLRREPAPVPAVADGSEAHGASGARAG